MQSFVDDAMKSYAKYSDWAGSRSEGNPKIMGAIVAIVVVIVLILLTG